MARRKRDEDEPEFVGEGEEALDPEGPDPDEMDEHDEPDIVACPRCNKAISEEAERCHHCGYYVVHEESLNRPGWTVFIVVLLVLAMAGVVGLLLRAW